MNSDLKISVILRIISIVMLVFALGSLPYFYFQMLRWVVCGTSLYTGYLLFNEKKQSWAWIFFVVGIVFNPVAPFYLSKSTWQMIDLIVGIFLVVSLVKEKWGDGHKQ